MHGRRRIRELALQVLFVRDVGANDADERLLARQLMRADESQAGLAQISGADAIAADEAARMAQGAWEIRENTARTVERLAPQWPTYRQPAIDRNILRLAVWELNHSDTPPKVVLDEAIELAKRFSTEHSAAFVNGVLDHLLREQQALLAPQPDAEAAQPDADQQPAT